jgi:CheY-like chemotaxis protein
MNQTKPILVVEDDQALREAICDVLRDEGYATIRADTGEAALALLHADDQPALVLLDLMMPTMNGWQFRQAQLSDPTIAQIPVVIMTASRNLEGRPIQADRILYKPVSISTIVAAIEDLAQPAGTTESTP